MLCKEMFYVVAVDTQTPVKGKALADWGSFFEGCQFPPSPLAATVLGVAG